MGDDFYFSMQRSCQYGVDDYQYANATLPPAYGDAKMTKEEIAAQKERNRKAFKKEENRRRHQLSMVNPYDTTPTTLKEYQKQLRNGPGIWENLKGAIGDAFGMAGIGGRRKKKRKTRKSKSKKSKRKTKKHLKKKLKRKMKTKKHTRKQKRTRKHRSRK